MADNDVLIPWYTPGEHFEDIHGTHGYSERYYQMYAEEHDPNRKPKEKPKPPVVKAPEKELRRIVDRHVPDFGWAANVFPKMEHAEIAATARLALRGERDFVLSDPGATDVLRPWFVRSRQQGLASVAFVMKYRLNVRGLWADGEESAVLCWYKSGGVSKLTIQAAGGKLQYQEQPLAVTALKEPVFQDNLQAFREALLDIATVAYGDWWHQLFMDALQILDSKHCTYDEAHEGFFLPEPYYKYLLAVRKTRLGAGMGSWQDLPVSGSAEFRIATHQLEYEKCQALLYAVNNC